MNLDFFSGKTPEILVADDTLESLRMLSDALANYGYEVRSVASGTLALASIRASQPDLILLDIKMPDLSGYEVCARLKADSRTQDIPVIFISALNETFDKVQAFAVGGVDYIPKPFQIDEVLARIHSQLALRFSMNQIHQLNAELEKRVQDRTTQLQQTNQSLQQEITERTQIEASLRESETKFRQLSEHIQQVFWLTDFDPKQGNPVAVKYVSPAFELIWGRSAQQLYNRPWEWSTAIHPEDRDRIWQAVLTQMLVGTYDEEYRVVHPNGSIRWIHDRGFPLPHTDGLVHRVAGIAEDITERKQAELERDRFFNLSLDLLFIADYRGRFKRLSPAWTHLLGYSLDSLIGQSFWHLIHPDDRPIAHRIIQLLRRGEDVTTLEMRCRCDNGLYLWTAWNAVPFLQEKLIYGAGRNISQRKASEARLIYETLHDSLTGLANRVCFMDRLELAVSKSLRQSDLNFAVLFIDLDGFKSINDTLGHLVGDQLLICIAKILDDSVREIDSVARFGGDEFTILLEDVQGLWEILEVSERIQSKLKPSFQLPQHEVFTSASIGIVFSNGNYQNAADIVRDADIAMYRAKAKGKACYEVFDQAMYAQTLYQVELETHLRGAIANQELQAYYQPIVDLQDNLKLQGFEVLLRWNHPQRGMIPAHEFIPIAEHTGLIMEFGEWVLKAACQQLSQWRSQWPRFEKIYLSVNISGRQLREISLLETLDQALEVNHIPPYCLKLEITESSLIENTQVATHILQGFQDRGIQVSLDDFGTGFSSLRYLHQFPINIIKIDQSFVEMMQQGAREYSIVHSIITLAGALGFATVAEGIESCSQLDQLKQLGCQSGQGFLFSKPMPADQVEVFLQESHGGMLALSLES